MSGGSLLPLLPAQSVTVIPREGALESSHLVWFGAACLGLAVVLASFLVLTRPRARQVARQLAHFNPGSGPQPTMLEVIRDALLRRIERALRTDARQDAARRLDRAGLRLQVGELVMTILAIVLLFGGLGFLGFGPFGSIIGVVSAVLLPRMFVDQRFRKRRAIFEDALPDVLSSIANVLRVGYSLNVGLGTVAKEYGDPINSELNRAINESRVSGSITDALRGVARRMDSVDLMWVADAIEINSTVGGDLVEVLDNVANTIRARARLNAQVSALTAEARMSAIVLFLLPPGLGLFIAVSNPEYFDGIWGTSLTYWMIGLVTFMLGSGGLWIRRMIDAAVL